MTEYEKAFLTALDDYEKEQSVIICLDMLAQGIVTVEELYLDILTPALNRLVFTEEKQNEMIWKEHVQSAIIRAVIEAAFPYVLAERRQRGLISQKRVLVFCPEEEQHELGARMAADFFAMAGYKTTYLGARTPIKTLLRALEELRPDLAVISITNSYNLFSSKRTIEQIRNHLDYDIRLLAGGSACADSDTICRQIGVDGVINDLRDILDDGKEDMR